MHHLFIINKHAGTNKGYLTVIKQLENLSISNCTVKYTEFKGHATVIARSFAESHKNFVRIYACGGDGTFNEVLNGVYDLSNCAIAVIPIGSGNDFIRSFKIPNYKFLNISNMIRGKTVSVDLLKCNDKIGANSVTIGYDCAVAKNVDKFKRLKFLTPGFAYKLSIVYCLISKRRHNFKIIADGKPLQCDGTYLLSVAAKGKYYGGGIKCSPKADNCDGYIDFMYIPTVGVFKFVRLLNTFIKGEHIDNPKICFVFHDKFNEIQYISDKPVDIGVDGEIFSTKNAKISVIPKAQQIILPKD